MPTTLIIGGSGKVARHITQLLTTSGHTVHSIIRNPSQAPSITALGAHPIVQSIESASIADLTHTIRATEPSTVIWAAGAGAGSGPARTTAVDHEGAIKAAAATAQAGVTKRYIVVSALDVRDRDRRPEPEWYDDADRARSDRVWSAIGHYMAAKFAADQDLVVARGRELEYTIVRPGALSEDAGTGRVEAGKVHLERTISREDVARVVVECMKNEGTKGLAFDVVGGDETSVEDAVAKVARERIDTFEGRY